MKLKEYLLYLNTMIKENPKCLDMTIIYATDEEGNEFKPIVMKPCICQVDSLGASFMQIEGFLEDTKNIKECNAVILN